MSKETTNEDNGQSQALATRLLLSYALGLICNRAVRAFHVENLSTNDNMLILVCMSFFTTYPYWNEPPCVYGRSAVDCLSLFTPPILASSIGFAYGAPFLFGS